MKISRIAISIIAACFATGAFAQSGTTIIVHGKAQVQNGSVSLSGLAAVQQDLVHAIQSMESALPIYDGDRVKSIRMAHRALVMIDRAVYGSKSKGRAPSTARDRVPSQNAHTRYNAQQIAASQSAMMQGLQDLVAAQNDFQAAVKDNPGKKGVEVENLIGNSQTEAKSAIAIHGG